MSTDFDLGEGAKVMILSVPEGDDKPLKYPGVFQASEAIILNKVDTMSVFNFDEKAFRDEVAQLNPKAPIFPIAATKGEGVDACQLAVLPHPCAPAGLSPLCWNHLGRRLARAVPFESSGAPPCGI